MQIQIEAVQAIYLLLMALAIILAANVLGIVTAIVTLLATEWRGAKEKYKAPKQVRRMFTRKKDSISPVSPK